MGRVQDRDQETIAAVLLYAIGAGSLFFLWFMPAAAARLGIEDGFIENMSALLLLASSLIVAAHGVRFLRSRHGLGRAAALAFFISFLLFVFAGEEISWGQRLFNIETGEFMQQYNWQGEINLHNLQTDIANIAFHYGAFFILVIVPLFRSKIAALLQRAPQLSVFTNFIAPSWLALPSFIFLGMIDSRFIFMIEKPWAASLYLLALVAGCLLLFCSLQNSLRLKKYLRAGLLLLSLFLIFIGLLVSYVYMIDEQATNMISEYKELFIAAGILVYSIFGIHSTKA